MATFLNILLLTFSLVTSEESVLLGKTKAEKLRSLASNSGGIIQFTAESFQNYIIDQPRPYTVVVLFTTTSAKYKCASCEEVQHMISQVAYSYKEAGAEYPSVSSKGQKTRAVFFGVLEYSQQTHSIYQKFGFVSVPNILVTHPKSILDEGTKFSLRKEDLWEFNAASEVHTQKVLDFVNSRTERNVEIKVSTFEALFTLIYSLLGIGIICYIGFVLRKLLLIPYVWFAVGMLVYLTCMAGVVYDIIHGVPWIGTDQQGQPEFIHTGQRSQYGLEGFMMSFVICAGGLAIVGINLASKITNVWTMRGVGGFSIIVLLYSLFRIIQIYKVKANWYNPGMAPPGHYTRGPLIRDQGNSF